MRPVREVATRNGQTYFEVHQRYIAKNPVEARLAERAEEYVHCSANGRYELEAFPQGLKPSDLIAASGAAKAAPFQSVKQAQENR